MKCKCQLHPFAIIFIIIGLAMCVVSHTAAFKDKNPEEEEAKVEEPEVTPVEEPPPEEAPAEEAPAEEEQA
ncbi:hypothetical protein TcasGA2_TC016371 [Tribolium castaneum]|uniref:Uncharacterized protein n=1 Tax=Tribolium castaneum TaxID=7070 RepID=D6WPA4_TRICA|nr:hypothetical protein TcasGA2_TC016371 [Tribolium castaneum]